MEKFGYLKPSQAEYVEELFQQYLQDPFSVDESWRYFFEGLELGSVAPQSPSAGSNGNGKGNGSHHNAVVVPLPGVARAVVSVPSTASAQDLAILREVRVAELIHSYRKYGHWQAQLDPLTLTTPQGHPLLDPRAHHISEADLAVSVGVASQVGLKEGTAVRDVIAALKETYSRTIGVEFTYIQDQASREWLQIQMERSRNRPTLTAEEYKRSLLKSTEAEAFEHFIHTRYIAQKRFSVEGGDAVIPALDHLVTEAGEHGVQEIIIGMAHRGRLNVLANILSKKYEMVFTEFEGNYNTDAKDGEGDVKYHLGHSADVVTPKGKSLHLSLLFNPSHLEAVNPVAEGMARAKQNLKQDVNRSRVVPILIHGDAAVAGQGIIYETSQLSQLSGYRIGGTIHFVINNQVGFTTNPSDSRSTPYCTDLAKMLDVPVFHVNGDDIEAVLHVTRLAVQYQQKFKRDVFIDLICYRKYGHNEGDEPTFTQPLMYKKVKDHATPRAVYAKSLAERNIISAADAQKILDEVNTRLAAAHTKTKQEAPVSVVSTFEGVWKGFRKATDEDFAKLVDTAVPEKALKEIAVALTTAPQGFHVHPKLVRLLEGRRKMVEEGAGIDWGMGEALGFATLLAEGVNIRLSGQDCERGTFSHRHSVLNDHESGQKYTPLNHIKAGQGVYDVYNSPLSEASVLGFEFGYSLADPKSLVIWEAQFGDFANGAQIVIDQFLAASESKWQRRSGLTLLLPHGYEGQGPEHSSARLERFLQLCGRNNMQVCNCTTPAQIFHLFRRQMKRPFRIPLVVMTPKSLLRHPKAVNVLGDFNSGGFQEVMDDMSIKDAASVRRVVLCSGKIYYELLEEREKKGRTDIALVRMEQLYPWPKVQLQNVFGRYTGVKEIFWVQEEPRNMGSWRSIMESLVESAGATPVKYVGRDLAAAPAVGSAKLHAKEQAALVEKALG